MTKPMVDHLMVQQQLKAPHKRWKHMVGVMCLNLTYRKHVKIILPKLFARYPSPEAYLRGRLKTQQYLTWNKKEASDLHGIGKYGSDSYQIFFFNHIPPDVKDKELKKYIDKHVG